MVDYYPPRPAITPIHFEMDNGAPAVFMPTVTRLGNDFDMVHVGNAVSYFPAPGWHDVVVHGHFDYDTHGSGSIFVVGLEGSGHPSLGIPSGNGIPIHPHAVAQVVASNPYWNGEPIRLVACRPGVPLVQEFADALGVDVITSVFVTGTHNVYSGRGELLGYRRGLHQSHYSTNPHSGSMDGRPMKVEIGRLSNNQEWILVSPRPGSRPIDIAMPANRMSHIESTRAALEARHPVAPVISAEHSPGASRLTTAVTEADGGQHRSAAGLASTLGVMALTMAVGAVRELIDERNFQAVDSWQLREQAQVIDHRATEHVLRNQRLEIGQLRHDHPHERLYINATVQLSQGSVSYITPPTNPGGIINPSWSYIELRDTRVSTENVNHSTQPQGFPNHPGIGPVITYSIPLDRLLTEDELDHLDPMHDPLTAYSANGWEHASGYDDLFQSAVPGTDSEFIKPSGRPWWQPPPPDGEENAKAKLHVMDEGNKLGQPGGSSGSSDVPDGGTPGKHAVVTDSSTTKFIDQHKYGDGLYSSNSDDAGVDNDPAHHAGNVVASMTSHDVPERKAHHGDLDQNVNVPDVPHHLGSEHGSLDSTPPHHPYITSDDHNTAPLIHASSDAKLHFHDQVVSVDPDRHVSSDSPHHPVAVDPSVVAPSPLHHPVDDQPDVLRWLDDPQRYHPQSTDPSPWLDPHHSSVNQFIDTHHHGASAYAQNDVQAAADDGSNDANSSMAWTQQSGGDSGQHDDFG